MLRSLLFAAAGCLAVSCATNPAEGGSGRALRVSLLDYRSQKSFELVSESHTSRVEQYSKVRAQPSRKVQTDEIMGQLVDWMDDHEFGRLALAGPAPRSAPERAVWSLELEEPEGVRHCLLIKDMPAADGLACRQLIAGVLDIFNNTYGAQTVEVKEGETPFQAPEAPRRKK